MNKIKSFRIGEVGRFSIDYQAKDEHLNERLELNKVGENVLVLDINDIAVLRAAFRHIDLEESSE